MALSRVRLLFHREHEHDQIKIAAGVSRKKQVLAFLELAFSVLFTFIRLHSLHFASIPILRRVDVERVSLSLNMCWDLELEEEG